VAGYAERVVLTEDDLGRLGTLAELGTARAAEGLSGMIDQPVSIGTMGIEQVKFAEAQFLAGDPQDTVAAIYLEFEGGLNGIIVLVFDIPAATTLVDLLMMQEVGTTTEIDEMGISALGEVGNQGGSAFLNALADAMGLSAMISPPAVLLDMAAAVLNTVVTHASMTSEEVIAIRTSFSISGNELSGYFLVLPDSASLQTMAGGLA
jgi:chemotaxis protein CheC